MKKLLFLFLLLLTSACGPFMTGIQDHTNPLSVWHGPGPYNNYIGDFASYQDATYNQIEGKASEYCSAYGGLKIKPYKTGNNDIPVSVTYWKYQCNGPQVVNHSPEPIRNPAPVISLPTKQTISIDDAKQQCKDIGYKPGTEKFGNCVLELTK
jgi:hypothetical protein